MTQALSVPAELQEAEYARPYHWLMKRSTRVQYERMSTLIAALLKSHLPDGGHVLDAGCGDGRGTHDLFERLVGGSFELRGCDYSERAILHARAMTYGSSLDFTVADLSMPLDDVVEPSTVDAVILREVIEHFPDEQERAALGNVRRALRPGGLVIVTVPSASLPVSAKHYRHYTPESLQAALSDTGFVNEQLTGFGYRPLYSERIWKLNRLPKLWRLLNPLWREVTPSVACILVAVGRKPSAGGIGPAIRVPHSAESIGAAGPSSQPLGV